MAEKTPILPPDSRYDVYWDRITYVSVGDYSGHSLAPDLGLDDCPNYASIEEAVADVGPKTMILVFPGTYTLSVDQMEVNKPLVFRGMGDAPADTHFDGDSQSSNFLITEGGKALIENMRVTSPSVAWRHYVKLDTEVDVLVEANRVWFESGDGSAHCLMGPQQNDIEGVCWFRNCTLEEGYNTVARFLLDNLALEACYCPSYSEWHCSGTLYLDDFVESETTDYGHDSGSLLVAFGEAVPSFAGTAITDAGNPVDAVLIRDWTSYEHLEAITPAADGAWESSILPPGDYGITYVAAGHQPITHGPYTVGDG